MKAVSLGSGNDETFANAIWRPTTRATHMDAGAPLLSSKVQRSDDETKVVVYSTAELPLSRHLAALLLFGVLSGLGTGLVAVHPDSATHWVRMSCCHTCDPPFPPASPPAPPRQPPLSPPRPPLPVSPRPSSSPSSPFLDLGVGPYLGCHIRLRAFVNQFVSCFLSRPVSRMSSFFSVSVGYGLCTCSSDKSQSLSRAIASFVCATRFLRAPPGGAVAPPLRGDTVHAGTFIPSSALGALTTTPSSGAPARRSVLAARS